MLTTEHLKRLKQVNVSISAEKTKDRIKFDFANSTNKEKREIVELSGQKRASFYRAYEKGAVNARLVLAISQVLNVSPFYYTGEDEERQRLTEELSLNFLEQKGYGDLVYEIRTEARNANKNANMNAKTSPKRARKPKEEVYNNVDYHDEAECDCCHGSDDYDGDEDEYDEEIEENEVKFELFFPDTQRTQDVIDSITEDDMVLLLRALIRRAEAGHDAAEVLEIVKRCLLS